MDPTHFSYILMAMTVVFWGGALIVATWADKRNAAADEDDE